MTTTAAELVARADELRPRLVELQAETEKLTYYSQEIHEAFLEARFYDVLVPKRYGGLELDLGSFWRMVIAVARGCPSTAWCLCLPAGHALQTGILFEEEVQAELFGDGSSSARRWRRRPGARSGSRRLGADEHARLLLRRPVRDALHGSDVRRARGRGRAAGESCSSSPSRSWTMLDDWGDTLGLKGSGSHSVRFEQAFIPERFVLADTWMVDTNVSGGTPGVRIHGNPMYAGRTLAYFEG